MSYHPAASPSALDAYNTSAPFRASPPRAQRGGAAALSGGGFYSGSMEGSPQKPPQSVFQAPPASPSGSPGGFGGGRPCASQRGAASASAQGDDGPSMSYEDIVRQRAALAREQARLADEWRQLEELSRRLEAGSGSGGGGGGGGGLEAPEEPGPPQQGGVMPGAAAFTRAMAGAGGCSLEEEVEAINAATEARCAVLRCAPSFRMLLLCRARRRRAQRGIRLIAVLTVSVRARGNRPQAAVQAALNLQLSPSPTSTPARRGEDEESREGLYSYGGDDGQ